MPSHEPRPRYTISSENMLNVGYYIIFYPPFVFFVIISAYHIYDVTGGCLENAMPPPDVLPAELSCPLGDVSLDFVEDLRPVDVHGDKAT